MLRAVFQKPFIPFALLFYRARYRGIWGMREALRGKKKTGEGLLHEAYYYYFEKRGSWISHHAEFSSKPLFPHEPLGVFVSGEAKIGKNAVIFQQVTIGSNTLNGSNEGSPHIGDNAYLGAGAKIIGGITIGDNCRIGANAVVYTSMPSNSVAVCEKTRIIQKENLDNRYYSRRSDGYWAYYLDGRWVIDPSKRFDSELSP